MLEQPPLGLYIHIPWCIRKCPYCDFNSHQANDAIQERDYITKLFDDFLYEYERLGDHTRELQSIFIGGGTPSLFSGESYKFLIQNIRQHISFSENIEITIEANPGAVDSEQFRSYIEAGINRLSIGAQSFNNKHLEKLGRIHSKEETITAINIAKSVGFKDLNVDLMHGLPGQSVESAIEDLKIAVDNAPTHISWYQLTIEPNTYFYSYPPNLPEDIILHTIYERGIEVLESNGYSQYEVSAFAQKSKNSSHNCNYWNFGDYIGIGAGAHGKLTMPIDNKLVRSKKLKQPNNYMNKVQSEVTQLNEILIEERTVEFLMNALRLRRGFSRHLFEKRTGIEFGEISKRLTTLIENELNQIKNINGESFYSATRTGYRFLDTLLGEFL